MLIPVSSWLPCLIKSMFYTLSLTSLCAVLHVRMINGFHNCIDEISFTSTIRPPYSAKDVYILSWDNKYLTPNVTDGFPKFKCPVKNCVFTTNKTLLKNLSAFDAIVFDETILTSKNRPKVQSPHQIFVFMSIASSYKYPACEVYNDHYFNWTFTYRADSDLLWKHYVVRDLSGTLVAPSNQIVWINNSDPIKADVKTILRSKTRAVVWIVDNPSTKSYEYLMRLEKHLRSDFGIKLYKYKNFERNSIYVNVLSQDYQFVLAFDQEHFMSKKLMDGYRNYAVPVVYSTIDYKRFLPPGSYINAYQIDPYDLAQVIHEASKNLSVYESYFKWTNVYSVEGTQPWVCDLCEALNHRTKNVPAKKNFRFWWNTPHSTSLCLPKDFLASEEKNI